MHLREICFGATALVAVLALAGGAQAAGDGTRDNDTGGKRFEVDPFWPKPLPNNWITGQVGGIAVGWDDTIWILQRPRSLDSSEAGATDAYVFPDGTVAKNDEGIPIDGAGHERPFGPIADCCLPAPSVMQFDKKGNLLQAWGGPADEGYLGSDKCREENGCFWPATEHGIYVDHNGFVYIAGNGFGDGEFPWSATHGWDAHVLKFTSDGTHVLTIGAPRPDQDAEAVNNATDGGLNGTPQLWRPADMEVDHKKNELYIADGYGNHRVVVVDAETGQYKRHWGAYGQKPVAPEAAIEAAVDFGEFRETIPPDQRDDFETVGIFGGDGIAPSFFRNPVHCVRHTDDGKVYVCDRTNNRMQVFDASKVGDDECQNPDHEIGKCGFLGEKFIRFDTLGPGSIWDLDTSTDPHMTCLYNADGTNQHVDVLHRPTLQILETWGHHGRHAGEFHWVHNLATDSQGNLYTAEVDTGKRAQKFVLVGPNGCKRPS